MKIKVFSSLLFCLICQVSVAQGKAFPENKYRDSYNAYQITGFSIGGGYSSSHFLNDVYGVNMEEAKIKSGFGYAANMRLIYKSVFAELTYFISNFNGDGMKQALALPEEYAFTHRGVEATANFILMPASSGISFIKPYIGAGYQIGEAAITTKQSFIIGKDLHSSEKTNAVLGQVGVLLFPSKQVYISAAYKRSFDSFQKNKGHSRLEIGFAYLFGGGDIRMK
ncbi:MAG TPA: outer membrane beta-barrel protein [Chitinophagaceae bacterium]|nr:outer membrane beta-barrel protein [Chitinophagaceae bacterium]